jgi:hypothetical protein
LAFSATQTYCDTIPFRAAIRIGNPFFPRSFMSFAQEGAPPSLDPLHPGSLNILVKHFCPNLFF